MVKHFSHVGRHKELPLAMAMYAVGILPLINQLQSSDANQVWFADDATAGGCLEQLHEWWVKLNNLGPPFGYFPNPSKTWLIVKEKHLSTATQRFLNTGVNITKGTRHLGTALGSRSFVVSYPTEQVEGMDIFHPEACIHCQNPTTCCLFRFHTWLSKQVDILPPHHPWNLRHTPAPSKKQSTSTSSLLWVPFNVTTLIRIFVYR